MKIPLGVFTVLGPALLLVLTGGAFLWCSGMWGSSAGASIAVGVTICYFVFWLFATEKLVDRDYSGELDSESVGIYLVALTLALIGTWIAVAVFAAAPLYVGILVLLLGAVAVLFAIGMMQGGHTVWEGTFTAPLVLSPITVLASYGISTFYGDIVGTILYCILLLSQVVTASVVTASYAAGLWNLLSRSSYRH